MLDAAFVPSGDFTRDKKSPLVSGGVINRDKRSAQPFIPVGATKPEQKAPLLSRLMPPTGIKGPCPPAGPASRWTRDKSHLLSRAQRLPGQMARNKCLFCSSGHIATKYRRYTRPAS